ncbi:MAG: hypothetical protein II319_05145 [Clostridia bacterium]|nr:hypothetical protein [Clostridia bacterium]
MKYYKQLDESGEVIYLLSYDTEPNITDPLTVEITAEEYETISAEWREAARVRAEAEKAERQAKAKEKALKAKAYDIITGAE